MQFKVDPRSLSQILTLDWLTIAWQSYVCFAQSALSQAQRQTEVNLLCGHTVFFGHVRLLAEPEDSEIWEVSSLVCVVFDQSWSILYCKHELLVCAQLYAVLTTFKWCSCTWSKLWPSLMQQSPSRWHASRIYKLTDTCQWISMVPDCVMVK